MPCIRQRFSIQSSISFLMTKIKGNCLLLPTNVICQNWSLCQLKLVFSNFIQIDAIQVVDQMKSFSIKIGLFQVNTNAFAPSNGSQNMKLTTLNKNSYPFTNKYVDDNNFISFVLEQEVRENIETERESVTSHIGGAQMNSHTHSNCEQFHPDGQVQRFTTRNFR